MIAPLRRRHFRIFIGLALVLPPVFVLALGARPESADLGSSAADRETRGRVLFERSDLFATQAITVRVNETSTGARLLTVSPVTAVRTPDTLVYWLSGPSPNESQAADSLPPDAVLLGPLRDAAYPLPDDAADGRIVLYSLGHQEVVGQADLTVPPGSAPLSAPGPATEPTADTAEMSDVVPQSVEPQSEEPQSKEPQS